MLNPCAPAAHFLTIDPAYVRVLSRRIHGILFLVLALILVFSTGIRSAMAAEHWYLIRAVFFAVATGQLVWLVSTVRGAPPPLNSPKLRGLIVLLLLAGFIIELLGFRNLSLYLFKGLLGTALLGVGLWLLNSLLQDSFDGVDTGRYAWERQLRDRLSLGEGEPVPGLIWLRLLTVLLIWLIFGVTVVGLWGYSDTFWSLARQGITEGFQLGPVRIVPINWAIGIVVFSGLVTLVRWIRNEVLPGWIKKSRIERGAQEAIFCCSNARSVPATGSSSAARRAMCARSASARRRSRPSIAPNSELISNQVTNWMLRDPWGRVIVPVGVAYGSDVEKVREVLLHAAREHPLVIGDGTRVGAPRVLFRGFGDSALNFELRFFIRIVDQRLATVSDLNFAIEKGLREANIEIPFPQRDLHLRSVDSGVNWGDK